MFKKLKQTRFISLMEYVVLVLCLGTAIATSEIVVAKTAFKAGAVVARTVVLNENGQPILVEFDESGNEVRVVQIPNDYQNNIDSLTIMSAETYRFYEKQLGDFLDPVNANILALGAELMDANQFETTRFLTAGNNPVEYPLQSLPDRIKSVLVRGRSNRLSTDQDLVLLSFPVDLANPGQSVSSNDKSVVLSPEGAVIASSSNSIAYRVGFFGNPDEPQDLVGLPFRSNDDVIFGPVSGVKVYVNEFAYPGGVGVTDEEGKYSFSFRLPPCPLGGFEFTTDVWAEVRYKNLLPIGSPAIPYYLRRQEWDYCFAGLVPSGPFGLIPVYQEADLSVPLIKSDLKLDVMVLTGLITMRNLENSPVTIGGETSYSAFSEPEQEVAQTHYDFNADGVNDTVVLGKRQTVQDAEGNDVIAFVPQDQLVGEEPDLQGVYYSAADLPSGPEDLLEKQPEFIRIIDNQKRLDQPVGILESISVEDFKNTDILFFRESTGQLVMERRGLRDEQVNARNSVAFDGSEQIAYRVMLRGPRDSNINVGGGSRTGGYEQWAVDNMLTEPFQEREANHLKPGETVRVVAINRATGYIGTQTVKLSSAANDPSSMLSVVVDPITLQPPHLKIWAERDYTVEKGLTAGSDDSDRHYVIGSEGAGLTSDTTITIYTEWLDQKGVPLPDELGLDNGEQYGLTGRLAKVVAPGTLQGTSIRGTDLAEFPIAPGRKIQALEIEDNLAAAEHYYVHVIGKAKDQECVAGATCPSFNVTGTQPPYDSRPALLTPFQVPLFDEDTHWESYKEFRQLEKDFDPASGGVAPTKPLPAYAWQYRPEYQFTQFELEMQEIDRVAILDEENESRISVLNSQSPKLFTSDDFVEIFFSLFSSNFQRLTPIDGNQELVLALGAEEININITQNQQIKFNNLEHLEAIEPEDFLSMRLYSNNDAGNILWEWAFRINGLDAFYRIPHDEVAIALDNSNPTRPVVRTLGGLRLKYQYTPPAGHEVQEVEWTIQHNGWYCQGPGIEHPQNGDNRCQHVAAGTTYTQTVESTGGTSGAQDDGWYVWWEPSTGGVDPQSRWQLPTSNAAVTMFADFSAETIDLSNPAAPAQTRTGDFAIQMRELRPNPADPMEGNDVKMLEAMLWQFGLSPQKGANLTDRSNAGSEGNRINSTRPITPPRHTVNCDSTNPNRRDIYSGGWLNCAPYNVALEGMVKRFQGRNDATCDDCPGQYAGNAANGIVNNDVLVDLKNVWEEYYKAYQGNQISPVNYNSPNINNWLIAARDVWQNGGVNGVTATYTDVEHTAMLSASGQSTNSGTLTRLKLLRDWKSQEAPTHWGIGHPVTPYRITEGGSDEYGSIGFSQIKYAYKYGDPTLHCEALDDYNLYDPSRAISGMIGFVSADSRTTNNNCGRSFYRSFAPSTSTYSWRGLQLSNADLVAYRQTTTTINSMAQARTDDSYELLMKALAGYNGRDGLVSNTWANMLTINHTLDMGRSFSNRTYAIQVMRRYGVPARTYIWQGGNYPQYQMANGQPILDVNGNPIPHPQAGQQWCFSYGENEWINGHNYNAVEDQTERHIFTRQRPGDLNNEVACP